MFLRRLMKGRRKDGPIDDLTKDKVVTTTMTKVTTTTRTTITTTSRSHTPAPSNAPLRSSKLGEAALILLEVNKLSLIVFLLKKRLGCGLYRT